jgi:hypothetical protein
MKNQVKIPYFLRAYIIMKEDEQQHRETSKIQTVIR